MTEGYREWREVEKKLNQGPWGGGGAEEEFIWNTALGVNLEGGIFSKLYGLGQGPDHHYLLMSVVFASQNCSKEAM